MKKSLLVCVFCMLLTGMPVKGADILEDFAGYTEMLRMLFHRVPASTNFVDDTTAHQFIRLSVITLSPILKADKATFIDTTVVFNNVYVLDTAIWGILGVEWVRYDTNQVIEYMPRSEWRARTLERGWPLMLRHATKDQTRRPYFYDHIDDTLFLFPTPIKGGDTLRITGWQKVTNIAVADDLDQIPQKFRAPIVHYAAWLLARSRQHLFINEYRLGFTEALNIALGASVKGPQDAAGQ